MKNLTVLFILTLIYSSLSLAEEMPLGIFVGGDDSYSAAPAQGITVSTGGALTMRVHTSCFPTNLRGVTNPISPNSLITANFDVTVSGQNFNYFVSFPGNITTNKGMTAATISPIQKNGNLTFTKPGPITNQVACPHFIAAKNGGGGFMGGGGFGMGGGPIVGNQNNIFCMIMGTCPNNVNAGKTIDKAKCVADGYAACTPAFNPTSCIKFVNIPIVETVNFQYHNLPDDSFAGIYGNTIQLNLMSLAVALKPNNKGQPINPVAPAKLNSYSFKQEVMDCSNQGAVYGHVGYSGHIPSYACGAYMAKNGAVTASVSNFKVSSDNSAVDVSVAFPGQTGFCGGWWSPLMVFFDDERPHFTNISDFPLNPGGRTSWVEAKSKGYFLVYDEKLNGKIISKEQLFGDSEKHKNGFEKLAEYDSNKDGWINAKDKKFKYLFLWNDTNGNGISEKTELFPAKDKLVKISLNYDPGSIRPIGKFAEEREKAKFYFKKAGKIVAGDIIDIWLSPQSQTSLAVNGQ